MIGEVFPCMRSDREQPRRVAGAGRPECDQRLGQIKIEKIGTQRYQRLEQPHHERADQHQGHATDAADAQLALHQLEHAEAVE